MLYRWPGCFIPPVPEKQAVVNNKNNIFTIAIKYTLAINKF